MGHTFPHVPQLRPQTVHVRPSVSAVLENINACTDDDAHTSRSCAPPDSACQAVVGCSGKMNTVMIEGALVDVDPSLGLAAAGLVPGQAGCEVVVAEAGVVRLAGPLEVARLCSAPASHLIPAEVRRSSPVHGASHASAAACAGAAPAAGSSMAHRAWRDPSLTDAPSVEKSHTWSYRMHP